MARKFVRKTIPFYKPLRLIELAEQVAKKDVEMGDESPLKPLDMDKFRDNLANAIEFRNEADALRRKSLSLMQKSRLALGTEYGQSINTPGTVYHDLALCRDLLSVIYKGNEERLELWGFNVVVTSVVTNKKKKKL